MAGVLDKIDRANLTIDELADHLYLDEELPVTRRQLRQAVIDKEITPTKLGNRNYFSIRDGLDWVAAQKGVYRGDKKRKAEGGA